MDTSMKDIEERVNLTGSNRFELLLFKLGKSSVGEQHELFGINVFKVREIMVMPPITAMAKSAPHVLGVANIRGQIIPVIDLPSVVGCTPTKLNILLVTEFARTVQAFAVEEVNEIVRLEWKQVLSAEGQGGGLVTSIARLDGDNETTRLAQVLDVEQILRDVMPEESENLSSSKPSIRVSLPPGTVVLAADDSQVAREMLEKGLKDMGIPFIMTKNGKEAWDQLQELSVQAAAEGKTVADKVALMLTDLEMPEMDGFTLTRNIKRDPRFNTIPVVIHSSLTGTANEGHVKSVGADGYVAKFVAKELASAIREVLSRRAL
jgi:two-component system chemotaxis response regulator CheV